MGSVATETKFRGDANGSQSVGNKIQVKFNRLDGKRHRGGPETKSRLSGIGCNGNKVQGGRKRKSIGAKQNSG